MLRDRSIITSIGLYFKNTQIAGGILVGEYTIALAYITAVVMKAVKCAISLTKTPIADKAQEIPSAIMTKGRIKSGR